MENISGMEGMNFSPISNYNNYLKSSSSFDVNTDNFENVLNQQTKALQNPMQIQGGIQADNFENILAQNINSVAQTNNAPSGNFIESFGNSISNGLNKVDDSVKAADRAQEALAMGENVSVHDVMISAEKASLNLQMAMQIRNKLVSAYTEINNIRV
jgi:flagellar hook-basal body complex protein FliE